jgi:hypothetical protein
MSHGQPVTGVRSAAMISIRREMSRDGVMVIILAVGMGDCSAIRPRAAV